MLDCINKNFISSFSEPPDDSEIGMLSGLRFMAPMEQMEAIYSSPDRNKRIIMANIDAQKGIITFYTLLAFPNNKVISFDIKIDEIKKTNKDKQNFDFGATQILNNGTIIRFGSVDVFSSELIKLFGSQ